MEDLNTNQKTETQITLFLVSLLPFFYFCTTIIDYLQWISNCTNCPITIQMIFYYLFFLIIDLIPFLLIYFHKSVEEKFKGMGLTLFFTIFAIIICINFLTPIYELVLFRNIRFTPPVDDPTAAKWRLFLRETIIAIDYILANISLSTMSLFYASSGFILCIIGLGFFHKFSFEIKNNIGSKVKINWNRSIKLNENFTFKSFNRFVQLCFTWLIIISVSFPFLYNLPKLVFGDFSSFSDLLLSLMFIPLPLSIIHFMNYGFNVSFQIVPKGENLQIESKHIRFSDDLVSFIKIGLLLSLLSSITTLIGSIQDVPEHLIDFIFGVFLSYLVNIMSAIILYVLAIMAAFILINCQIILYNRFYWSGFFLSLIFLAILQLIDILLLAININFFLVTSIFIILLLNSKFNYQQKNEST